MHQFISSRNYRVLLIGLLAASLAVLWSLNERVLANAAYIPVDDFGHYWAAGRLTLQGANPYDPIQVQIERDAAIGMTSDYDVVPIMWTPPWTIPLVLPFGLFSYPLGRLAWLLVNIACILVCSDYLWRLYHGPRRFLWLAWLCAFAFGPTISVLQKGQITPFILVGITGFLYNINKDTGTDAKRDWTAGLWASLITIKPQLFYLFWPLLLFWCARTRRWAAFGGAATGVAAGMLTAMAFNPDLINQYLAALFGNAPSAWATPTIGGYLRLLFGLDKFWLQFVAPGMGLAGLFIYWIWQLKRLPQQVWDWPQISPALLFGSVLTAAYAWTYDQVILLPAILYLLTLGFEDSKGRSIWILVISLMAINLADLLLHRWLDEFWFGWLAPAYLLWYWIGYIGLRRMGKRSLYKTQASIP